ncbi:MAG: sigma-70 family RNA polymerase sigma factor [Clostridia bacterium]|nr:sigma-70 family RNA polymerase sigma factor [Clostridia bacterium]
MIQILSRMVFMVLSVVGSHSFPKPLTAKQEREALAAMAAGDAAARQRLIEHNLRLVAHIIKKHYASSHEQEDLISIGTIGLIKAVDTFDSRKGSRLATYASRCIENATLSQMSFWARLELPTGELPSRRQKICI